jgi:hypothetical protein
MNGPSIEPGPVIQSRREQAQAVMAEIQTALAEIEYGSIVITIHQGQVVGLETSRKRRLTP